MLKVLCVCVCVYVFPHFLFVSWSLFCSLPSLFFFSLFFLCLLPSCLAVSLHHHHLVVVTVVVTVVGQSHCIPLQCSASLALYTRDCPQISNIQSDQREKERKHQQAFIHSFDPIFVPRDFHSLAPSVSNNVDVVTANASKRDETKQERYQQVTLYLDKSRVKESTVHAHHHGSITKTTTTSSSTNAIATHHDTLVLHTTPHLDVDQSIVVLQSLLHNRDGTTRRRHDPATPSHE